MLLLRFCKVDGLAWDKRQLAMDDSGTYGASDGGQHGQKCTGKRFERSASDAAHASHDIFLSCDWDCQHGEMATNVRRTHRAWLFADLFAAQCRSEERRVGKECRSRW